MTTNEERGNMAHPLLQSAAQRVLEARDQRAFIEREMIESFHTPVVCMTVVSPGATKDSSQFRIALSLAAQHLENRLQRNRIFVLEKRTRISLAGPEIYLAVSAEAHAIKQLCIEVEEELPWGRLLDIDVVTIDSHMAMHKGSPLLPLIAPSAMHREELGVAPRTCLVCNQPAFNCRAANQHSIHELNEKVDYLLATLPLMNSLMKADTCLQDGRLTEPTKLPTLPN